ncbi:MAG TPA: hypothetical protein GXX17_00320 [Clostridiales bacterium]|nr:hypothetical protein [Clostridiales bacterium]
MSTSFIFTTVIEILVGAFIIWGVLHEDVLIDMEDRLFLKIRNCFKKQNLNCVDTVSDDIQILGTVKRDSNCA